MSFLGGAASGGSQVLDERRKQAARDKETKESRQWQIATEARADAKARKLKRDNDRNSLDSLLEEASLYYDADDMKLISGNKSKLTFAIARAKELSPYDIRGGDLLKLPSINSAEDMPTGSEVAATKGDSTYASLFAGKPKTPEVSGAKTYKEQRLFASERLRTTSDPDEMQMWTNQIVEMDALMAADNAKNNGPKDNALKIAQDSISSVINGQFADKNLLKKNAAGEYLGRMKSNEPEGFRLMGRAYASMRKSGAVIKGSVLDNLLKDQEREVASLTNGFAIDAATKYNEFVTKSAELKTTPTGGREQNEKRDKLTDEVAKLKAESANFVPLDINKPMTPEDINAGAWRNAETNQVIQVKLEDGSIGYAIRTDYGVLRLGFN